MCHSHQYQLPTAGLLLPAASASCEDPLLAAFNTFRSDSGADTLVHGHTHRPGQHLLDDGLRRLVLSDWDAQAQPPRAELLRLDAGGWRRIALKA